VQDERDRSGASVVVDDEPEEQLTPALIRPDVNSAPLGEIEQREGIVIERRR
jgi:hypothetical protein